MWVYFDSETLELGPFLYFGGKPGEKLPNLESFRVAKHAKGNAKGVKTKRPNHRVVNKSQFKHIETIEDLWNQLFGGA